jgi:hypothetical protein
MSLKIDLPSELERRLEAEARRQGISTDALARIMLEQTLKLEDGNGSSHSRILAKNLPIKDRSREVDWLRKNRDEYAGLWVALDGDSLIASGDDLKQVAETARQQGVPDALMMRVEASGSLPFAGF